jgi:hypothetical protein
MREPWDVDPRTGECAHGFPARYVKRCPDCRRARRRKLEADRFRAAAARQGIDVARLAANDGDDR